MDVPHLEKLGKAPQRCHRRPLIFWLTKATVYIVGTGICELCVNNNYGLKLGGMLCKSDKPFIIIIIIIIMLHCNSEVRYLFML